MGYFRFRKTFSILPGVRVNLSKTGVSSSIGGHGATVNVGKNGPMVTLGIPGTGLSYRTPVGLALVLILLAVAAVAGLAYLFAPETVRTLLHWWQPRWF
ncbi:conserved hypothetical protein [Hyphomicrobium sp. GJ21]|mgnify:FL=1|jgi:hypothetical protein|uniref:DUF4236 domain-containing protein n=1 Tax=Hyphomicrobium sp. GJ21 TaxID=113574 RepID=UPI000622BA0E|nr:DUF4236 domain-containing protein [Hyphomicrobium sp. GJ21]CEJ88449.1 conserved hypothetical protein [Hyphomicrobium sp. GJ21]